MQKTLRMALSVALLAALSPHALAHGEARPLHGGTVQVVADIHYELVPQARGATLHVLDHGQPVDVRRMRGKLTVLNGTQKTEAPLTPAGAHQLEAVGVRLAAGAKAVASLQGAGGQTVTVRFSIP